jgi:hypothetical protein
MVIYHLSKGQEFFIFDLPKWILIVEYLSPQLHVSSLDEIPRLRLEEGVLVADCDQLLIALAPLVGDARQVGVALLAVASDNLAIIVRVLSGRKEDIFDKRYVKIRDSSLNPDKIS